ncbi:SMP-30/gluconolactonase/LRE family protein [Sphingobium bisphenolivorans]|uniref:SMP-30/gluconolactonase/LRE family protein n=1 Tax=Sphingobium bisphenolivorans TaxID=1335760 RepID=UPI0003AAD230|nr:SMP-30/gluconolactonase/LRE family protein [Sphingobium bisphenolivorans]
MAEATTIVDGMTLTENARWHGHRLWFCDHYRNCICSVNEDGSDLRIEVTHSHEPSGLGWLPDGRLLFVSMQDRRIMRREHDGRIEQHADLSELTEYWLNDMVVDPQGRAWVGGHGFALMEHDDLKPVSLFRVDPDGAVTQVSRPLFFPNGSTIIAGRTLVVAESFAQRLAAFDILPDGRLSEDRDWAAVGQLVESRDPAKAMAEMQIGPDGISDIDEQGGIWAADFINPRAVRLKEGEGIIEEIETEMNCYAVCLGGGDGRTLFMCLTPPDFDPTRRANDPRSKIVTVRVAVPVAGEGERADTPDLGVASVA